MIIKSFFVNNPLRNYNHYMICRKQALVFDPLKLEVIMEDLSKYPIEEYLLFNTHHKHWDHVSRNEEFLQLPNSRKVNLSDKQIFTCENGVEIESLFTPGHQPDHHCFLIRKGEKQVGLISGDHIFNAGVGNCKDGGDPIALYKSVQKVLQLDDDMFIYPSHDYFAKNLSFAREVDPENPRLEQIEARLQRYGSFFTTLGQEREINPFLRIKELKKYSRFQSMTEQAVFVELRRLRDDW